ncbi:MAG TPA: hypothetical protein VMH87_01520 [Pseudomonadales bacterium]|nr:hypothetical protein [Pseudomonadales bacterium]
MNFLQKLCSFKKTLRNPEADQARRASAQPKPAGAKEMEWRPPQLLQSLLLDCRRDAHRDASISTRFNPQPPQL